MARKQTMKVYHGIPKSITDKHTIHYLDIERESGLKDYIKYGKSTPVGLGIEMKKADSANFYTFKDPIFIPQNEFTIEFWVKKPYNSNASAYPLFTLDTLNNSRRLMYIGFIGNTNKVVLARLTNNYQNVNGVSKLNEDFNHIRITYSKNTLNLYINGKLDVSASVTLNADFTSSPLFIGSFRGSDGSVYDKFNEIDCVFSDLHISNIDRGDYFPNLPQDFIDGKAVIKPRMGQQQIKGDPMHSQVTTLKVDTDPKGIMYKGGVNAGFQRHTYKPELSLISSNFESGTSIKIKGLNGEIISGIIDSDTALCVITSHAVSAQQWSVDDVSKLKVGDTIVCTTPDLAHVSPVGSIAEINISTKTIKLSSPLGGYEALKGYYIFETTALTSSPAVKTQNGTNVVGTWSGLGTKEATFVLGDNTNLRGQDLYIEYSLAMPCGNSDFPELPHAVERAWGENGVEMKPVDNITIIDDYYRKIAASNKECPHITRWRYLANINEPPSIGSEDTQFEYDRITTLDGEYRAIGTGSTVIMPQKVFSFNLLKMLERKMGAEIPSANKIQWLKDNIAIINFNFYGYGSCPSGSKVHVVNYFTDNSRWNDRSWSHSSKSVQCLKCGISGNFIARVIDSVGFVHFLAYTDISTSTAPSEIVTDYASIEVTLKADSAFTTLYCENTRAREDKCNPVLIQKETKTVKRYLPSKECFATESTRLSYKDVAKAETGEIVSLLPYKIVTTNGTASLTRDERGVNNYTDKIFLPSGYNSYNFLSSPIHVSDTDSAVSHTVQLPIIRYWGGKRYHGVGTLASGLDSCQTITTKTDREGVQQYEIYAGLKDVNGQLVLVLRTDVRLPNNSTTPSTYTNRDYALPNRPLIK